MPGVVVCMPNGLVAGRRDERDKLFFPRSRSFPAPWQLPSLQKLVLVYRRQTLPIEPATLTRQ